MTPGFIAARASSKRARGRFGLDFLRVWQGGKFGDGSKPAGRRLRPQFRRFAAQGWLAGVLGGEL